jgi:hypothetical protein
MLAACELLLHNKCQPGLIPQVSIYQQFTNIPIKRTRGRLCHYEPNWRWQVSLWHTKRYTVAVTVGFQLQYGIGRRKKPKVCLKLGQAG